MRTTRSKRSLKSHPPRPPVPMLTEKDFTTAFTRPCTKAAALLHVRQLERDHQADTRHFADWRRFAEALQQGKPPVFLKGGDVVEVEIDRLGVLRNPVVQG